jgi:DNA-binding beta-propeller fold protein YncE
MRYVLMLGGLALAAPVDAQMRPPSEAFRAQLTALPEIEVVTDTLSVDATLGFITAVSADRAGNLYVLHRPERGHPVIVLDSAGRLLRSWGADLFGTPHSIRLDPAGHVWIVDAATSTVQKFTSTGAVLETIQFEVPRAPRPFCGTTDIAFGHAGSLFVTDGYCNGRVVKLDSTGNDVGEWGTGGSDQAEFFIPHGIAITPDGRVLVADRNNSRIQVFDQEGRWLSTWEYAGMVSSVAVGPLGKVYASLVFDLDWTEGYVVELDPKNGRMMSRVPVVAHELAISPDGHILPAVEDVIVRLRPVPSRSR